MPHQLYAELSLGSAIEVWVIEHPLLLENYAFHRNKLILHRASISAYLERLHKLGVRTRRVECGQVGWDGPVKGVMQKGAGVGWDGPGRGLAALLRSSGVKNVSVYNPNDDWLLGDLQKQTNEAGCQLRVLDDPHFLTSKDEIDAFSAKKKKLFFTEFYVAQRKRLNILLDANGPLWGKWSFDSENRKKLPKGLNVAALPALKTNAHVSNAIIWLNQNFPNAPGTSSEFMYPVTHEDAQIWLERFIEDRLLHFGPYEDAISEQETFLFHSVLTPALNIGLLTPQQILKSVLSKSNQIPPASLEGFIRQVIGWREFVRLVYLTNGRKQRSSNFWKHTRAIPRSFYSGETGVLPFDHTVKRVLQHGYCHHIERLMILGNFMLLCEIEPNEVYRWFMELFIDSYDWVMVPNVYGMSQYADGGFITTKPYISGSNYILKMSNYKRGPWCETWDALYWRFIWKHQDFFSKNPRLSVMTLALKKMGSKIDTHLAKADNFLASLE
jgi:deoxyribodipyrimidine photolyase-related protein